VIPTAKRIDQSYDRFLNRKRQLNTDSGFEPLWMPEFLYPFQRHLVDWAIRKGRGAIFADCGLGKTPMQLVWAQNVVQETNKPVLILTPLAVAPQTVREADKFGIAAEYSKDGTYSKQIVVSNYERMHYFNRDDFAGVVGDESSCIKHFESKRSSAVKEFTREIPYRLLCTATAAPNDYVELGTSSEALGYLGQRDMITRFFTQVTAKDHLGWGRTKWRLKEQAAEPFWRWICSWSRAIRRPSDFGYDDGEFALPDLKVDQHVVKASRPLNGMLFAMPAIGLDEQRAERRSTINERCERVAEIAAQSDTSVAWCHLNTEGDMLTKCIDGAVQVSGKDSDDSKEEKLLAFQSGQIKKLVTKSKIAGWGLNWQHCSHTTMFPSHSFEQYYQSVRRFHRFGQVSPVTVDIVTTEGELSVLGNLTSKADKADEMFDALLANVMNALSIDRTQGFSQSSEVPSWV
jgi:hypothetical protein|tara:strand:+ start:101 stop:1480 length:1380 start_codon:yes stop_codon:yes gene_type:complete